VRYSNNQGLPNSVSPEYGEAIWISSDNQDGIWHLGIGIIVAV
jgi:hypothetical protein